MVTKKKTSKKLQKKTSKKTGKKASASSQKKSKGKKKKTTTVQITKALKRKGDIKTKAKIKKATGKKKSDVSLAEVKGVKKEASKKSTQKKVKSSLKPSLIKEYRELLLGKRALIEGDLSRMQDAALRASGQDPSVDHMADHGTDNYDQDFTLGLIENVGGIAKEIDDALKRIEGGTFGICEGCECSIPPARLKAIPYARFCVNCQSELENT